MGRYADSLPRREGPRPTSHPRRRARQEAAGERWAARALRDPAEQLNKLIIAGHGNCREADRLRLRFGL